MIYTEVIIGKYINLRAVTLDDAEFIVKLRNDEKKKEFLHATSTSIDLQKEWISKQLEREGDYYFVICDKDGNSVGLASIYGVGEKNGGAEFGRWISWGNALQNVESVILLFDFAFNKLNVKYLDMNVMAENKQIINFWKRFGGTHVGLINENDLLLDKTVVTKEDYLKNLREKNTILLRC